MTRKKQRLYFVLFILASLSVAAGLALYAFQENITYFYSPGEVKAFAEKEPVRVAAGRVFRLGGLVKEGSLQKQNDDLVIRFIVTDLVEEMTVSYKGIAPDLFREGQGVVAKGRLENGVFIADELLAKHDENYMPPEVAKALKRAHEDGIK